MEEQNDIFDNLKAKKTPLPDASYFENLAKTINDSQKKTRIIPIYKRPKVWIGAVAAALIASFLIFNLSSSSIENSDPLLALNEVSSDEISSYIEENIDDFDIDLITDALNDQSISELQFSDEGTSNSSHQKVDQTSNKISFDDINVDDILDYLKDQGIDPDDLEDDESFI